MIGAQQWFRKILYSTALLALFLPLLALPITASACDIDGTPSAIVDGVHVIRNPVRATIQTYNSWATFAAVRSLRIGRLTRFSEDIKILARGIPSSFYAHPWQWRFGDGSIAIAGTATHRYRKPGHYAVLVYTFVRDRAYPAGSWIALDRIAVSVR